MAQECSSPLCWLLLPALQRKLLSKHNDCLKPIQTRAGQSPEGPEVLVGSDKLQKGSNSFDDYQEILHLPDWAAEPVRSS